MDSKTGQELLRIKAAVVEKFTADDWRELGLLTGTLEEIEEHPRLLRSLSFGDEDYGTCALGILRTMYEADPKNLSTAGAYFENKYGPMIDSSPYTSVVGRMHQISPTVFKIPSCGIEDDQIAVMMPFASEFNCVYASISQASAQSGLRCLRVDDMWEDSTIVQDIFSLVFRSKFVVVDFSGKNPNVMYETGIAHTLGRIVIPITQSMDDVPFDLRHHRVLKYLRNTEGLNRLTEELAAKLTQLQAG